MQYLLITLVAILSAVDGFKVPSFVPPKFPVSTVDNDGVSFLPDLLKPTTLTLMKDLRRSL
jgi:hypothetical protein